MGNCLTFPIWEYIVCDMRVIATRTINAYRKCYPDADEPLRAWVALMESRNFKHLPDLQTLFPTADLIAGDRVVFNIKGNNYRLIAGIDFNRQVVFIKWFGRHKDYDKINPSEVQHEYPPC
jgi:mRNA interferase HigB